MLNDYDEELTLAGGHRVNFAAGDEYGSRPYDMKLAAAGHNDPAVGEPIQVFAEVVAAATSIGTSLTVALVADTDGAGASEVVLATKVIAAADLTVGSRHKIGTVGPGDIGISLLLQYLTAKLTVIGTTGDGYVRVRFQKGNDVAPANAALFV